MAFDLQAKHKTIRLRHLKAVPDANNLETFVFFCANKSKNRISKLTDEKTISYNLGRFRVYYNTCYKYQISYPAVIAVRTVSLSL